jgi:hypothetical protein
MSAKAIIRRMAQWKTATTDAFDAWFRGQSRGVRIEVAAAVEILAKVGPWQGRPLVDTLRGSRYANMKELRLRAEGQVIRIAFAFDPRQTALLLTAGAKQGVNEQRFYKALIRKADALYAAHLAALQGQR